jgi:hypothetical protein
MIGFSFSGRRGVRLSTAIALFALAVSASPASSATFDHAIFSRLLGRSVSAGRINYGYFSSQPYFDVYLATLAAARPQTLTTNERLAFWINAYNALTIRNVIDHPGIRRVTEVTGFFDKKKFSVAGRSLTLNDIENTIIRPQFKEPLIHFGLVCAAVNCPPILPRAYVGRTVRKDLAENARAYLASSYNRYDARTGTLHLSKIFDWYKEDFGGEAGIRKFVAKYGTAEMKKNVTASTPIAYLEYDWALNSR